MLFDPFQTVSQGAQPRRGRDVRRPPVSEGESSVMRPQDAGAARPQPAPPAPDDWGARKVREWLLLLLRFAVTRDSRDLHAACAMADEIDAVGLRSSASAPSFFLRATTELCAALAAEEDPERNAVIKRHLTRIEDIRLRRAFRAAAGIDAEPAPAAGGRRRKRR